MSTICRAYRSSLVAAFLLLVGATGSVADVDIYGMIARGELDSARRELAQYASAATRNGDILFYQSLLETNAAESARLMQASLQASVAYRYREEIYYRLAQYYFMVKDYDDLSHILLDYYSLWETGTYHAEMQRLSALLDEVQGHYDAALKQCDRYLVTYTSDDCQQLGQIDKARIMRANNKSIGSLTTLKQISRAREGIGIAAALYLLGMEAANKNRADDAVFYYNLLREGYPSAVGLDRMVEQMGDLSGKQSGGSAAEKITGTFYSIKVGVFSTKENAQAQADAFRRHDLPIDIKARNISGKNYHVVYVGRFQDYQEALKVKSQLEEAHGEPYQVVTR